LAKHTVTVAFTKEQNAALKKEAKKLNVSSGEVLRRLVNEGLLNVEFQLKCEVDRGLLPKKVLDMPLMTQ
jgi:Mn-dependent DtxR family transcriptional regulator